MGFASTYLDQRPLFPEIIIEAPDESTGMILVVPAYNEPEITNLLDSLILCDKPDCAVEVIIIINAPCGAPPESLKNNILSSNNIKRWKIQHTDCFFRLFVYSPTNIYEDEWGVGLARKTGMDEAVRRFNTLENPDGVILCLDADCQVEKNYFVSLYNEFYLRKDLAACSIYFEHPVNGNEYPESIYRYISFYELHLRYYLQALAFTGFPYLFHTIGSAMAVKALQYIRVGGMNRRKAGEDFYFIQKLIQAGNYFNLNSTVVYPSPRVSDRVPFGTGASILKLKESDSSTFLTYNLQAFKELGSFFSRVEEMFRCPSNDMDQMYNSFPSGIKSFITYTVWKGKIEEIMKNTSGLASFKKRFFGWFNMFRVVKFMNFVHLKHYKKMPVDSSASELLISKGFTFRSDDPVLLLKFYRSLEKA